MPQNARLRTALGNSANAAWRGTNQAHGSRGQAVTSLRRNTVIAAAIATAR